MPQFIAELYTSHVYYICKKVLDLTELNWNKLKDRGICSVAENGDPAGECKNSNDRSSVMYALEKVALSS